MRSLAVLSMTFVLAASPLYAQGRGHSSSQGIPPGQLPPAGLCRVWYDGVPPGRQPQATNCNEAERIASRDNNARVIYGDNYSRNDRYGNDRYGSNSTYGNAYPNNRSYGVNNVAYDNGYRDGLAKGTRTRAIVIPSILFATRNTATPTAATTAATARRISTS